MDKEIALSGVKAKKCINNPREYLDKSIECLEKYYKKVLNDICVGTAEEFQYTDKIMKVLEQLEDLRGK